MNQTNRNAPCPCGSGKKFKNCCAVKPTAKPSVTKRSTEVLRSIEMAQQYVLAGQAVYAEILCNELLEDLPDHPELNFWLGSALTLQGKNESAIEAYRNSVKSKPDHFSALSNLGALLSKTGRYVEAEAFLRRATAINQSSPEALANLGASLFNQGKLDDAIVALQRALKLKPSFINVYYMLGMSFYHQGKSNEAIDCYNRAIALNPNYGMTQYSKALPLLRLGELEQGWKAYELRWSNLDEPVPKRDFPQSWWQNESLEGKSILLWGEQGIGDEIFFASMYSEVIAKAGRCIIECAPKLLPLFTRSFPGAHVVPKSDPPHQATHECIDFQSGAGSLARWLRPTISSFPARAEFLTPDSERVAYWKTRLAELGPGPKVGLCWRSSNMSGARPLYCSTLDQWGPIFALPNINFVNLQYDECAVELDEAQKRFGVRLHSFDEVDMYNDLDEVAALMKALDLVITAPTSVPQLSGALGVPTWVMNFGVPWETMGTDAMPWLPSVKCFNRQWNQTWDETTRKIAIELKSKYVITTEQITNMSN